MLVVNRNRVSASFQVENQENRDASYHFNQTLRHKTSHIVGATQQLELPQQLPQWKTERNGRIVNSRAHTSETGENMAQTIRLSGLEIAGEAKTGGKLENSAAGTYGYVYKCAVQLPASTHTVCPETNKGMLWYVCEDFDIPGCQQVMYE
jgi:hypothetical protein